ncbi:MAG: FAD:protein FMN transferase [Thermoanaerobaculia bacterium]
MALAALSSIAVAARAAELPPDSAISRSRYLMGTICEVVVDGDPAAAETAFAEIERVEQLISTWTESSELSKLNQARDAKVSVELYDLLGSAIRLAQSTDGAFNPLLGPLVELWRSRGDGAVPEPDAIARVLPLLSLGGPRFDSSSRAITLPAGASFEEGGFGKGYALDRAAASLESAGATNFMIDFGGQLVVRSTQPVQVAIASPERRDEIALFLSISSGSLSTSSGSEKSFVVAGETYSHLLDPRDGRALPPRGSVSVVSTSAMETDVLSTALYVMGPVAGLDWADAHDVAAIFIVPASAGWDVILSKQAITTGFAVRTVRPDYNHREGTR